MAKHKDKKAKAKELPVTSKTPKAGVNPEEFYDSSPSWRASKLQMVEPYGWHELDISTLYGIHQKLSQFESMSWKDILVKSRTSNHLVSIDKLCKPARDRLTAMALDDVDEILSLRLSGKERVWGILDRGTVNLLWWDPNHEICPSTLKHT